MKIGPVSVPDPQPMMDATLTMVRAESAAAHGQRLSDQPDALQPMLRARLEQGTKITAVAYINALRVWAAYRKEFVRNVFADVDALVVPCVPELPPPLREVVGHTEEASRRLAHFGKFMRLFNGLGIPVLALPCGFTSKGIPLGMQIAARPFEEDKLLAMGSAYEAAAQWFMRWPELAQY
jgi:aspartyl-tRNA(Asn)/glutamyl-tRNA(Gln) amidotransferase subunit A